MRNKKSVLMTLNHNCGYFSGVGGIAGNGSYMKRGFARMFQVCTNLSSHVLYTVLWFRALLNY